MARSYQAFTYPYWKGQGDPAATLIPDEILFELFAGLDQTRLDLSARHIRANRDIARKRETWSRERTMALVNEVWRHVGGTPYQKLFAFEIARKPVRPFPTDVSPHMDSGGWCAPEGIEFRFDQSLSDPVYMAHESGHLVADRQSYSPRNICEVQAYFLQEAAYDVLAHTMEDRGAAARLHRLDEFLTLQESRAHGQDCLQKPHPENERQDSAVSYLHRHVSAMPLAIYMYKMMDTMTPDERTAALHALYHDRDATFDKITRAFGLNSPDAFYVAGAYAGNLMRNEAIALNLIPAQAARPAAPTA